MIEAAVSDLRDGVSTSFDTLSEIATRLGQLAPRASPTFTGNARAPTPSAGDDSTRIATTAWLQGFFGTASSREFTTAGSHSYTWEWGTSSGLVIVRGAGGGGGGGSEAQTQGTGSGGGGGGDNAGGDADASSAGTVLATDGGDGYRNGGRGSGPSGANPSSGDGGGGGGSSAVILGPDVYLGHGGGGGGGGGSVPDRSGYDGSFSGGERGFNPHRIGTPGGGFLTNGGDGGDGEVGSGNGGLGGAGETRLVFLSGLTLSDTFSITIGAGGSGGEGPVGATGGADGGAGSATFVPLF